MWDVVSALTPPLVVAATFGFLLFKLLRGEMAPKRTADLRESTPRAVAPPDDTPGDEGKSGGNTPAE
ncbi:MAG: hypothetical protein GEV11_07230 [Streptosporangiales bacterium]|nr:hypothetical protein [Streptosporangiales bacterium]